LNGLAEVRERFHDPDYDPDRPVSPVSYQEIRTMITELSKEQMTVLVEYYVTDRRVVIFVVFPRKKGSSFTSYCLTSKVSRDEIEEIGSRWARGLNDRVHPAQLERGYLPQILDTLGRLVKFPAEKIAAWEKASNQKIERVIVVPHRFLNLLPFHAAPLPDGTAWGEVASIEYVPSASVLRQLLRSRAENTTRTSDGVSGNTGHKVTCISYSDPSEDPPLLFSMHEAKAVAEEACGELLVGPEATPTRVRQAMRNATYIHFACHGEFHHESPLNSCLKLAPERTLHSPQSEEVKYAPLTLGDIFRSVRLPQTDLVVMSSCETGLSRVERLHEEYISLPAGFLYAGARTVLSALWPVSDVATWLLMRTFAREIAAGIDPAGALRRAQQEMRGMSAEYILQEIATAAGQEPDPLRREQMMKQGEQLIGECPFAGPYWWAGFTVNGLGDLPVTSLASLGPRADSPSSLS
jgi:CHAT domain-containing protein